MNKRIYVYIILVLVLGAGGYYAWNWLRTDQEQEQIEEEEQYSLMVEDEFELSVPSDWFRINPPEGIKLFLTDSGDEVLDASKEKEGFKSYLAVTYDKRDGKNLFEFSENIKVLLQNSIGEDSGSITFGESASSTINGRNALFMDATVTQSSSLTATSTPQTYVFKSLFVIVEGEDDDVWTMSFNTSEVKWEERRPTFVKVADSFTLKADIIQEQ